MVARLAGKIALVTGGTSGIGRAAALALADEGASVAVVGRRRAEGEETIELVQRAGGRGIALVGDVTSAADIGEAIGETLKVFGQLDLAVNNAGMGAEGATITDTSEETYDRIMSVNAKGVWLAMRAELRVMRDAGRGGAIVNTASVGGFLGSPNAASYVASKHAVVGLTKTAALENAPAGIRINCVAPGTVETDMIEQFVRGNLALRDHIASLHPLGRIGRPEEIAQAILWLCSDRSSFVTGHVLTVDGGYSIA